MTRLALPLHDLLARTIPLESPAAPPQAPLTLLEHADAFELTMDLPGVPADQLTLRLEHRLLVLRATRPAPVVPEGSRVRLQERREAVIERRLMLPATIDPEAIDAQLRDGVLTVRLGKARTAQPRTIPIQT